MSITQRWLESKKKRKIKKSKKTHRRRPLIECLERREMLFADIQNLHLFDDTGTPGDLITSNPTVAGTASGDFMYGADVEVDHDGDGFPEGYFYASYAGEQFTYDPRTYDSSLDTYSGVLPLQMRVAEYDEYYMPMTPGDWVDFTFTLDTSGSGSGGSDVEIELFDSMYYSIPDGSGQVDFGSTSLDWPVSQTFTIQNDGMDDLTLDASSLILPAGFSLMSGFDETVYSYGQTYFTIQLDASTSGVFGGTVSFVNNDADESPYSFDILGSVADLEGDHPTSALNLSLMAGSPESLQAEVGDGVWGTQDIDLYQVTLSVGQTLHVDIDADILDDGSQLSSLDSYVRVFDNDGTELTSNAEATSPDDFGSGNDSFLSFTATSSGTYFIGVTGDANQTYNAWTGTGRVAGSVGAYELNLLVEDPPPPPPPTQPSLGVTGSTVDEGTGVASFTLTLSEASVDTVTVDYTTSDGTAYAYDDYAPFNDTVTFMPGEVSRTFDVSLLDDGDDEPDEYFQIVLSNPNNATIANSQASITILDDDALQLPTLTLNSSEVTIGEADGDIEFTVSLSYATTQTVTVVYETTDVTATGDSDYESIQDTLVFAPGQTSQTISISILDDEGNPSIEPDESFLVSLSSPVNAAGTPQATVTIVDDDGLPSLSFSNLSHTVTESTGTVVVSVMLSEPSMDTVTVNYASSNGVASQGSDYTPTTGTLTFAPGETSQDIQVTILDDTVDETDEEFQITLSSPSASATLADSATTITILDDDLAPTVGFTVSEVSVDEEGGPANLVVTLSQQSEKSITVDYATSNLAATAGFDYTAVSGMLTFAPGETSKQVSVSPLSDTIDEADETFVVTLSSAVNATLATSHATVTIVDDDSSSLPTLTFGNSTVIANEDSGSVTVNVLLSEVSGDDVTVNYSTSDVSATAASDYSATSGTLTILAGDTSGQITIPILNDSTDEADESLELTLSTPTNATIATPQATITIADDDAPPMVGFSNVNLSVNEDAGVALLTVVLSEASSRQVTIDYATTAGSAVADADYATTSGTVTFAANETSQTISIPILNDTIDEAIDSFTVTLTSPQNSTLDTSVATVDIIDDDAAPSISFSSTTLVVDEGASVVLLDVTLSVASEQPIVVTYASSDVEANSPDDYVAASGTLTFAPGETTKQISVSLVDDATDELDESFTVGLSQPVNVTLAAALATITLVDNDEPAPVSDVPGDSFGEAMVLSVAAGSSLVVNEEIGNGLFGDGDVDYFRIDLNQGDTITIDVDAWSLDTGASLSGLDSYLRVLDGNGIELATNNNGFNVDDANFYGDMGGEITVADTEYNQSAERDAFLSFTAHATSTYYVSLSGIAGAGDDGMDPDADSGVGAYELHVGREAALPAIGMEVSVDDVVIGEGSAAVFTVTLSSVPANSVTLNYRTRNGSATPNVDYLPTSGTLTFEPGETVKTVAVSSWNDAAWEADETVMLEVSGPADVFTVALATIHDDPNDVNGGRFYEDISPYRLLTVENVRVIEGQAAEFIVRYNGWSNGQDVTVSYATRNRTTNGADFVGQTGSLSFAPGEHTKRLVIDTLHDWAIENEEQFYVDFATPWGDHPIAVGTIVDEAVPGVAFNDLQVLEGDVAEFVLTMSSSVTYPVTVSYSTSPGSATVNGDYTSALGTVTIAPGSRQAIIPVETASDWLKESDETFYVQIAMPWGYRAIAVANVWDDRANIPVITFDGDVAVVEGNTATLGVSLNRTFETPVTVDVRSWDGTASGCEFGYCEDFQDFVGTLTFAPGEQHKTVEVATIADWQREPNEEIFFELSSPRGIHDVAMVTIVDPHFPEVSISNADVAGGETAVFTVTLSDAFNRDITIYYDTYGGSAYGSCSDYCETGGQLVFSAGETSKAFEVQTTAQELSYTYTDENGVEFTESFDIPDVHYFAHAYAPWNDFAVGRGDVRYSGASLYTADPLPQLVAENDSIDIRHDLRPGEDGSDYYEWYYSGYEGVLTGNDHYAGGGWWGASFTTSLVSDAGIRNGSLTLFANGSFKYVPNPGFVGTESFQYSVFDGVVTSNAATVTINVTNDQPDAVDDTFHVWHDTFDNWSGYGVLENDVDLDGLKTYLNPFSSVQHGTLEFFPNGKFKYTPNPGFVGLDSFQYVATDGIAFDTANVTIQVHNDAPVALDDPDPSLFGYEEVDGVYYDEYGEVMDFEPQLTVWHDTVNNWSNISVLDNDYEDSQYDDPDYDPTEFEMYGYYSPGVDTLTTSLVSGPANGHVELFANGYFNYSPRPGFVGSDTFVYQVYDGAAVSVPATVHILVENDEPDAHDDPFDGEPCAECLVGPGYSIWTHAQTGTNSSSGGGNGYRVIADDAWQTPDLIVDGVGVLHNDADRDSLRVELTSCSTGRVDLAADGSFVYYARPGHSGVDSFTYQVTDGVHTTSRTVRLSVRQANDSVDAGHLLSFDVNVAAEHWLGSFSLNHGDDYLCSLSTEVLHAPTTLPVTAEFLGTTVDENSNEALAFGVLQWQSATELYTVEAEWTYAWNAFTQRWDAYNISDSSVPYLNDQQWWESYSQAWRSQADTLPIDSWLNDGIHEIYEIHNNAGMWLRTLRFDYDEAADTFAFDGSTFERLEPGDSGWSEAVANSDALWYGDGTNRFIEFTSGFKPSLKYYDVGLPTANVSWGDGTSSSTITYDVVDLQNLFRGVEWDYANGWVAEPGGHLNVVAGHTYTSLPQAGDPPVFVTVSGLDYPVTNIRPFPWVGSSDNTDLWSAIIGAPVLAGVDGSLSTTEGVWFEDVIGTFTDEALLDVGKSYYAWVDWGDGRESSATTTIDTASGALVVSGSHLYDYHGDYEIIVRVQDEVLREATAFTNVDVANLPPTAVGESYTTSHGHALVVDTREAGVLANDTDWGPLFLTAEIDTLPQHGTVTLNPDGSFTYTSDGTFVGADSFTYVANDGMDVSLPATVTIHLTNALPQSDLDSAIVGHDMTTVLDVLSNDVDADLDALTPEIVAAPLHGTAIVLADGTIEYTPDEHYTGPEEFTYRAFDGFEYGNTVTVSLTVKNDPPVLDPISDLTHPEETLLSFTVYANDPDDANLTYTLLNPAPGMTLDPDTGEFTWAPSESQGPGTYTITVQVSDAGIPSLTDEQEFTISVSEVNCNPVGGDDAIVVDEGDSASTLVGGDSSVLNNDTDADLPANLLSAGAVVVAPFFGTVFVASDGTFLYTHDGSESTADSFVYRISDGQGGWAEATVNVAINPVNDAPVAFLDEYFVAEDSTLNIVAAGVLANDSDAEGDTLTASLATGASHGSVTLLSDGSFTYVPDSDYFGEDVFTYSLDDGNGGTDTGTVTITVTPVNDAPVASDDVGVTPEDTTLTLLGSDLYGNDSTGAANESDQSLRIISVGTPTHGTAVLNGDGSVTYTPALDYNGPDSFTYVVEDNGVTASGVAPLTSEATVTITISEVNDVPLPSSDTASTEEDTSISIDVATLLNNDSPGPANEGSQFLSIVGVGTPDFGAVVLSGGSINYTPAADFVGTDTFTYFLQDDGTSAGSPAPQSAMGTVTVTVTPINDAPVATDGNYSTDEDVVLSIPAPGVLSFASDVDRDSLTASLVDSTAHGSITLEADGSFVYSPDENYFGSDTFTYEVTDGLLTSNLATVTIAVASVNDLPTIVGISSQETDEEVPIGPITFTIDDVETAASDLTFSAIALNSSMVANASFVYSGENESRSLTLTPELNAFGTTTILVTVIDGDGGSTTSSFTLTIRPINDAPVVVDDAYTAIEDTLLLVDSPGVLANDPNVDSDTLTATVVTGPEHGTLTLNEDGSFVYAPSTDFYGNDVFTYQTTDGEFTTEEATVSITVTPVNDAPTISDIADQSTDEDTPLNSITFSVDDLESPGVLVVTATSSDLARVPNDASHLTIVDMGNGDYELSILPLTDAFGEVTITIRVQDPDGAGAEDSFQFTINPLNDLPTGGIDTVTATEDTSYSFSVSDFTFSDVETETLQKVRIDSLPANGALWSGSQLVSVDDEFTAQELANGLLEFLPDTDENGNDYANFTFSVSDGVEYAATPSAVTIHVTAVNDAPTITEIADQTTNEDTPLGPITFSVGDLESLTALTVTATSLDVTRVANPVATIDLGDGNYELSITPLLNAFGEVTITVRVQDPEGLFAEDSFQVTINPVNDLPTGGSDAVTATEDTRYTFSVSDFTFSDVETASLQKLRIDSLPANGDLWSGGQLVSVNDEFTVQELTSGLLEFLANTDETGSDYTSFTLSVSDGTAYAATPSAVTIHVTPVNDAPTISDILNQSTDEDTPLDAITFSVADLESLGTLIVTATSSDETRVPNDAVHLPPPTDMGNGNYQLSIVPLANVFGEVTITVRVQDPEGLFAEDTFQLAINSVNDLPTGGTDAVTAIEDTRYTFSVSDFTFADVETASLQKLRIDSLPVNGALWSGSELVSVNDEFTSQELANGQLEFLPTADENGSAYTSFTFSVSDGADYATTSSTVTIHVTAVNDAPTISDIVDQTVDEDVWLGIDTSPIGFTVTDAESLPEVEVSVTSADSSLVPDENISIVAVGDGSYELSIQPLANVFGKVTITVRVQDPEGLFAEDTFQFTINPVNDLPTGGTDAVTAVEDTRFAFSVSDFTFSDVETATLQRLRIDSLPANGTLWSGNELVSVNDEFTSEELANGLLEFLADADENGNDYASFAFSVSDGTAYAAAPSTVTIHVTAVNDAPTISDIVEQSTDEDVPLSQITFLVHDFESLNELTVTITSSDETRIPNDSAHLTLADLGDGNYDLSIAPLTDVFGEVTITVRVQDPEGLFVEDTFQLTIHPVNDLPTGGSDVVTAIEDTRYAFSVSDFTFSDVETASLQKLRIDSLPSSGTLWTGSQLVSVNDELTAQELASGLLEFLPDADENGGDYVSFTLSVSDGADYSAAPSTVTIHVTAVNDAPTSASNSITLAEDTVYAFDLDDIPFEDADGDPLYSIRLSQPTQGTVKLNGVALSDAESTISAADVSALTYHPHQDGQGNPYATIDFAVSDGTLQSTLTYTLTVNVSSVNDTPQIVTELTDQTINEDGSITVYFDVNDVEDAASVLTVSAVAADSILLPASGISDAGTTTQRSVTLTPAADQFGATDVTITITDLDGASSSKTFSLTVNAQNDPGTIDGLTDRTIFEDPLPQDIVAWSFTISDPDVSPTALTVTATSSDPTVIPMSGIVLDGTGADRSITVTPAENAFGPSQITVRVTDPDGEYTEKSFLVMVTAVNDLPTTSDQTLTISEDQQYSFRLADFPFADIESTSLQMVRVDSLPTDGELLINNTAVTVGGLFSATDVINGRLRFRPAPNEHDANLYATFEFSVSDGTSFSAASAMMSISVLPINDAPTSGNTSITTQEDSSYTFTVADFPFSDVDGDVLHSIRIRSKPAGSLTVGGVQVLPYPHITPVTVAQLAAGELVFSPWLNGNGTPYSRFAYEVFDGTAYSSKADMNLHVTPVNDAPTIFSTLADGTISEDTEFYFLAGPTDVDSSNSSLIVTASSSNQSLLDASGITVNHQTRWITLTPEANESGTTVVTVTVADPEGATTSKSFTLTVNPVNDRPSLEIIPDQTTTEDTVLGPINISISDIETAPNDLQITWSASIPTLIENIAIVKDTSPAAGEDDWLLTVNPATNAFGSTRVYLQVRDSENEPAFADFWLTVLAENDPPTAGGSTIVLPEDSYRTISYFDLSYSDVENNGLQKVRVDGLPLAGTIATRAPDGTWIDAEQGAEISLQQFQQGFVRYSPSLNGNGNAYATFAFSVFDGAAYSAVPATITFDVTPVNDPPTSSDASITTYEDTQYTLELADIPFDDVEGDTFQGVKFFNSAIQFDGAPLQDGQLVSPGELAAGRLTYDPPANFRGTTGFWYKVYDGTAYSAQWSLLTITVNSVNDLPTISSINDQQMLEDGSLTVNFTLGDIDSSTNLLVVTAASSNPTLLSSAGFTHGGSWANRWIRMTPSPDEYGQAVVTLTVTDPDGGSASTLFTLTVTGVNDPPVISPIANQVISEDTTLGPLSFTVNDDDSDPLSLDPIVTSSNQSLVNVIAVDGSGTDRTLTITPLPNKFGNTTITIRVADLAGLESVRTFVLTVEPVNDLPTTPDATITAVEDVTYRFGLSDFAYTDQESVWPTKLRVDSLPAVGTLFVEGSATPIAVGDELSSTTMSHWLRYRTDSHGHGAPYATFTYSLSDGTSFSTTPGTMTINATAVNDRPTSSDTSVATLEDTPVVLSLSDIPFSDVDGDSLQAIRVQSNVSRGSLRLNGATVATGVSISRSDIETGLLTYTPVASQSGSPFTTFTYSVSDGSLESWPPSTMTINVQPENDAPTISDVSDRTIDEDGVVTINFNIGDIDSPVSGLTIQATSSNPALLAESDMTFGSSAGNSRSVTLRPTANASGQSVVTITVTDPDGATASDSFVLTVNPVNDAPTISDVPAQTTPEDTMTNPIVFTIGDVESPGDLVVNVTSSNSSLMPNDANHISLTGSGNSRTLSLLPAPNAYGTVHITIAVTDLDGRTTTEVFPLTITSINDPPVTSDSLRSTNEDVDFNFRLADFPLIDVDSPNLMAIRLDTTPSLGRLLLSGVELQAGDVVSRNTIGQVFYEPYASAFGQDTFLFSVSDGNLFSTQPATMTVDIAPINDPPMIGSINNTQIDEDTAATVSIVIGDAESPADALTVTATSSNQTLVSNGSLVATSSGSTRTLTIVPAANQTGASDITVRVTDEHGLSSTRLFQLYVRPINDLPSGANGTITASEDVAYSFQLSDFPFSDLESASLHGVRIDSLPNEGLITLS